jgi:putative transposase
MQPVSRRISRAQPGETLRKRTAEAVEAGQQQYQELLEMTTKTIQQAVQTLDRLGRQTGKSAKRLAKTLATFIPLPRLERVLKVGILKRGVPEAVYVDNGKVYQARQFAVACASLGIRCIHAAPYSPQGKGKQERFFETVRLQFLPEVAKSEIATLEELNQSFWAWLEIIYHQRRHSETLETPLQRYQASMAQVKAADPEILRKAFLWREERKVRKDGCIDLQGDTYQVDPTLAGRKLGLRFDPFDLAHVELFMSGNSLGVASLIQQGREKHIAVERLATQSPEPPKPKSSLDYLAALRAEYQEQQRKQAGALHYAKLTDKPQPTPSGLFPEDPDPLPVEA